MSDVRTFRAATMQAALDLVREELGSDAVILHTRQVSQRRLLPWLKAREVVEITASLEVNIAPLSARRRPQQSSKSVPTPTTTGEPGASATGGTAPTGIPAKPRKPKTSAATPFEDRLQPPTSASASRVTTKRQPTQEPPRESASSPSQPNPHKNASPAHRRRQSPRAITPSAVTPAAGLLPRTPPRPQPNDPTAALAQKLDSIQQMLENLGGNRTGSAAEEIPAELFQLYTELIDAEVENDLARELIFALKQNGTQAQLRDPEAAKALLTAMVEAEIRCAGPITTLPGKRKVVALVGPTGVGKTTTIAKLAANFRLRDGVKMGLVTVDTYRIAAVEQLRTYAEIIDLPMKVVTAPQEMRRALDDLAGLDLVLIDTAGRSPRDELKIQELKSLLAEAQVDEVHLVLSLTSSVRSLEATAKNFAAANTTSMILTKLDEAPGMGTLLSVARKVPLPVSYLTTGQDVPDDFEPANSTRIARLVLGRENIAS